MCKKVLLIVIIILTFISNLKSLNIVSLPKPGDEYISMADNGSWTWYGDPKAFYFKFNKEKTYYSWISNKGDVVIASYDHNSNHIDSFILKSNFGSDDHNHPSIIMRSDKRILAFYCAHHGKSMHLRISKNPEDITAWGPDIEILKMKGSNYTYPNVFQLKNEHDRIYLFYRGIDVQPTFSTSDDGGITWSTEMKFYQGADRPYCKFESNGKDRIHIIIENGHRANPHSTFYICYRNGGFYKADGKLIKKLEQIKERPILSAEAELVYDHKNPHIISYPYLNNLRGSVWDVANDNQDNPVFVFDVIINIDDKWQHIYYYYRWDGKSWKRKELINSGSSMGGEEGFAGGITLDHSNPDVIFLSRQINGIFEIEKWETNNAGELWESTSITINSVKNNTRPCVPRGYENGKLRLLWLYGDYSEYYNGQFWHHIKGYPIYEKTSMP